MGYISGSEFIFNKVPAWSKYGGGALALDKAQVSLDSSYFNDNSAPIGRDVYILDDESPEQHGSFLKCSTDYHKTVVFHTDQHSPSVVEAGSPGYYDNQNCVEYSNRAVYNQSPYQAHKTGYSDQSVYSDQTVTSNSNQYSTSNHGGHTGYKLPTDSKQHAGYADRPAPSPASHLVAYPTKYVPLTEYNLPTPDSKQDAEYGDHPAPYPASHPVAYPTKYVHDSDYNN